MEHDAFNMIPKANNTVCNGNSWHPHNPRKLMYRNHKWRHCSAVFDMNSFHRPRQSIKLIIWKY